MFTIICYRTTSMAYVYPILLGSCTFWLLSLILILACLVPDCAFNVLQNYTPAAYAKHQKVWNSFNKSKAVSYTSLPRISNIFWVRNSSDVKHVDFVVLKKAGFPFINFTWLYARHAVSHTHTHKQTVHFCCFHCFVSELERFWQEET
jgi:hypothetical protein